MCRRNLPLNALRVLEVASRHRSLTKAAEELAVTPAAIRHQVKALEDLLGVSLLGRSGNGVALTNASSAALPTLRGAFDLLSLAIEKMRHHAAAGPLVVACCPYLAQRWLLPRLPRFRADFPGIRLHLVTQGPEPDLFTSATDIVIALGAPELSGVPVEFELLMDDLVFAVCSPEYLARHRLHSARDLTRATLLHDGTAAKRHGVDWSAWMKAAGVPWVHRASRAAEMPTPKARTADSMRLDSPLLVLDAAVEGQGVALAQASLAGADLAAGRLVQVPGPSMTSAGYYLRSLASVASHPNVVSFREWFISEASLEQARLPGHLAQAMGFEVTRVDHLGLRA